MRKFSISIASLLIALLAAASGTTCAAESPQPQARNVVLVHGAWADGSSWNEVIPLLQGAGLNVVSVQNPLTSLSDDVAATRRALDPLEGPTVLVGHSYAGTVVSEVGGDPRVTGLVYLAARAPDAGEDFVELAKRFPTMPVRAGVVTRDGFSTLREDAFLAHFADGLPAAKAKALFAVQQPVAADLFAGRTTVAAWRSKPSWYAVSTADNTTSPDLQRFLAKRMGANVVELESGHLSLLTRPQEVARLILAAAGR
ncbi:alpha/beta hydrolase [Luteimonas sp. RD2P54]|uniref:Alpha/beta hydrolase n=1 Tax=Luteimonas endophytica TaxID=3042023 RepID=A0ABT6J4Z2_9GAMM|nr:alpha/beta hydrolase [Luteimonas endophytica]MDH5821871.1 alpha/beta hydrolase [Luteimonas endophytica]